MKLKACHKMDPRVRRLYKDALRAVQKLPAQRIRRKLQYNVKEAFIAHAEVRDAESVEALLKEGKGAVASLEWIASLPLETYTGLSRKGEKIN